MEKNTALTEIIDLKMEAEDLNSRTNRAVYAARAKGASWTEIGQALGVSKQAAAKKYSGPVPEAEQTREEWKAANPEAAAAATARGKASAQRILAEIHQQVWITGQEPELTADDVQEASVTPSIFVDPLAPAKPQKWDPRTDPKPEFIDPRPAFWLASAATTDGVAQPGLGKGPHACKKCGSTNHKGGLDEIRAYPGECRPTKYDPQDMADWLNNRFAK